MVITLDKRKQPLGFCTEKRARILIEDGRACVHRYFPFTIIVKDLDVRAIKNLESYRIKIDPGAVHTGISVIRNSDNAVMLFIQIEHRGQCIVKGLETRSNVRNNRRQRETRYRKCKWPNHYQKKGSKFNAMSSRPEGWLPPSVKSIGDNIISWVKKLKKYINITECSFEAVRFDSQLMENPNVEGEQYQHGTLYGYELKEHLLEKFGHQCQYCGGKSGDDNLEWEHMIPKSRGGSDRVANASLACHKCNQDKGKHTLPEYLDILKARNPKSDKAKELNNERIERISNIVANGQVYKSNRYSAWVNSYRRYVEKTLFDIFGDVECSSGGRTKYNRQTLGLPKDHHYDALCVGTIPEDEYKNINQKCLYVTAQGRGNRLRGNINCCGVITVKYKNREKLKFGFQSGDIVRAEVPKGKYAGTYTGRVTIRSTGRFDIKTKSGKISTSYKYCRILQHTDGYSYYYK